MSIPAVILLSKKNCIYIKIFKDSEPIIINIMRTLQIPICGFEQYNFNFSCVVSFFFSEQYYNYAVKVMEACYV